MVEDWLRNAAGEHYATLETLRETARQNAEGKLPALLARERTEAADVLSAAVIQRAVKSSPLLSQRIGQAVVHPLWGIPILLGVLFAVYEFVGVFGATTLVGLMEEGLFENDLKGNYTFVNDAACRLVGYERSEMIGMIYRILFSPDKLESIHKIFNEIYRTGEPKMLMDY